MRTFAIVASFTLSTATAIKKGGNAVASTAPTYTHGAVASGGSSFGTSSCPVKCKSDGKTIQVFHSTNHGTGLDDTSVHSPTNTIPHMCARNTDTNACECTCGTDGSWSAWAGWTTCTKQCGGGTQTNSRQCVGQAHGGADCSALDGGNANDSRACNTQPCPVDGAWSSYGSWGACSATCGGGTQSKTRQCVGQAHGGADCSALDGGSNTATQDCNTDACPVWGCHTILRQGEGVYKSIAEWSTGVDEEGAYSELNQLADDGDSYRGADGKFEFKITWNDGNVQHWKQSNNPMVHPGCTGHCGVTGYEAISTAGTSNRWAGLEYGGSSSVLDGSVGHSNWYYAVGSKAPWNNGIPGISDAMTSVRFEVCK